MIFSSALQRDAVHNSSSGRGRGRARGRGRGRGRGSQTVERETTAQYEKFEDDPDDSEHDEKLDQSLRWIDNGAETKELKENILAVKSEEVPIRNFDLNMDLDENGDSTTTAAVPASSSAEPIPEIKPEEYPDWSESEMKNIAIDPVQLANLSRRIDEDEDEDEDEEDYDEEG